MSAVMSSPSDLMTRPMKRPYFSRATASVGFSAQVAVSNDEDLMSEQQRWKTVTRRVFSTVALAGITALATGVASTATSGQILPEEALKVLSLWVDAVFTGDPSWSNCAPTDDLGNIKVRRCAPEPTRQH